MDARFQAMLTQNQIDVAHMEALGNGGCVSAPIFGHVAPTEDKLKLYLKAVCNLDPDTRVQDAIPVAKFVILWESCRKRTEVETEAAALRSVNRLPPQLTLDDFMNAREALEKRLGRKIPDWKCPSENYFQRKVGEIESGLKTDKLTIVTSFAQEERQRQPRGMGAITSMDFDERGVGTLRQQKTDFYVTMPGDKPGLDNRFVIMDHLLGMLQMRFPQNPVLATYEDGMMRDYAEYLSGDRVWGFVVKGANQEPVACPSQNMVMDYDFAIRDLQTKLVKSGHDFKAALESAMNDSDTRTLHFTAQFSMKAHLPECRALSAPGLAEMLGITNRGAKRSAPEATSTEAGAAEKSERAKRREKEKANKKAKAKAKAEAKGKGKALPAPPAVLAIKDRDRGDKGKGKKGKGKGKGKGQNLPKGAYARTADDKQVCFAHNRGEKCVQEPCPYEHICWFCHSPTCKGECKA